MLKVTVYTHIWETAQNITLLSTNIILSDISNISNRPILKVLSSPESLILSIAQSTHAFCFHRAFKSKEIDGSLSSPRLAENGVYITESTQSGFKVLMKSLSQ